MSTDYGAGRRKKGFPFVWAVPLVAVLVAAAVFGFAWLKHQPQWIADAKHWDVAGPPCREVSAQVFQAHSAGGPQLQVENYDDLDFGRAYGHISCADIHDDGGHGFGSHAVCQFSSPTRVVVRTSKGQSYFEADPGQPVTVSVLKDRPSCVIGTTEWAPPKG